MKFNSLAHSLLVFAYFICFGFHGAQAQNPNSLPLITVELLNKNDRVFKYPPPSPGRWHDRLSMDFPLSFRNASLIFWESRDYTAGSRSGTEIKLRLKCEAPYLTKWTITTHSKANAEDTKPFYHMNYNVKQLPRGNENPLVSLQPNGADGEFQYSLTELTVNGFGPEFKGGFINCVHRSLDFLTSELYIFQRFDARDRLKSVDQISRNVTDLRRLPCIVYDPDVKIKYEQVTNKKYNDYKSLEPDFTRYNWRLGYRIIKKRERDYKVGAKARCVLDNSRHVYYEFIERREEGKSSNTTITLTDSWDPKERITASVFVCVLEDSATAPKAAFQLEPCLSPDHCYSYPQTNSENIEPNETGDVDIKIQGRVSCSPDIDIQSTQKQDHYFRGLSGQVYLLSQMHSVPEDEVLKIKILEEPIIDTVTISCSTIKFLTFHPIKFSLIYLNGSKQLLQDTFHETLVEGVLDPGMQINNGEQVQTKTVKVKISENNYRQIHGIGCHVPWYNSSDWREIYYWTSGYKSVRDATFKEKLVQIEIVQARSENQSFSNGEWKFRCKVGKLTLGEGIIALHFIELVSCVSPNDCDANQEIRAIMPNTKKICTNVQNTELCEITPPFLVTQQGKSIDIQGGISCLVEVKENFIRSLPEYYFTGLSGGVYLLSQLPQQEEILNMEIKYEQFEYTSHIRVVCTAVNFLTLRDIKFKLYVTYAKHKPNHLTHDDHFESLKSNSRFVQVTESGSNFYRKTVDVPILGADEIELTCVVPWFNSTKDQEHFLAVTNNETVTEENTSGFPIPQNWKENWGVHTGDLHLIYYHDQVAFYSDKHLNYTSKSHFNAVSQAWTYAKETYGPLSDDPILNVVLHSDAPDQCVSSNMKSYVDDAFQNVIVIDCSKRTGSWATPADINIVVLEIGQMVIKLAKKRGSWPAFDISQWHMGDIVAYDILLGIYNSDEANLLLERKTFNPFFASEGNTIWFSRWYYRIYMKYENTTALDGFLSVLHDNWPTKENGHDYAQQLNFGQFVHFWSGAAGVSLKELAIEVFGWSSDFEHQFQKAVETYPQIVYKDGKLQLQQILFIAMPVVFVCILITVIVVFVMIHRKKVGRLQENMRELTNDEIQKFFDGNSQNNPADSGYAFIESQPFNKEYEIERDRLDIFFDRVLGSGAFGLVLSGKIKGVPGSGNESADDVVVAVKTVKPNVEVSFFIALLTELKVMCYVGKHPNVASLLGASTTRIKKREVYVALEFCAKGDLLAFVKKHRSDFKDLLSRKSENADAPKVNEIAPANDQSLTQTTSFSVVDTEPTTSHQSDSFSTLDLIEWSRQISFGMEFISSKNVIHGDLAARNVLLTENNVAKISDFGLSRQLHNYSVYMKKSKTPLPWRWMAIESLSDMNFSVQSDVWSFGVTLFEIFSLGTTPYPGCNWTHEFVDDLVGGFRLKSPQFGNPEIHDLMMNCMRHEPSERITFLEIVRKLQEIKRKLESELAMDSPRNQNYIAPS